ncbi:low molecular weight phosphatase family protein [Maribacter sp. CXY002]|uniref:arsenate-mycothiol transferase ArsC n=1 Tax=Maribacter luteocoastalis TaxID=3407671 RepID=UPI003B66CA87
MVLDKIEQEISGLDINNISDERLPILQKIINYIQDKKDKGEVINLNFICTHNSRRSHLSQIWAQTMAAYFGIKNVYCYSGGTEATALFPKVAETLSDSGFDIIRLSQEPNPVYAIKYCADAHPVIGFSKTYDHKFNPSSNYAAIMTCSHADENCPFIPGAEERIPFTFDDPKLFDNTPQQTEKYRERSLQIACELGYIFSKIK